MRHMRRLFTGEGTNLRSPRQGRQSIRHGDGTPPGSLIRSTALRTSGGAGPSGAGSSAWRRMCTYFHNASGELCTAMAMVGMRISNSYVDPVGLKAFVASRLIALDRCLGVRPIGVGEVT